MASFGLVLLGAVGGVVLCGVVLLYIGYKMFTRS